MTKASGDRAEEKNKLSVLERRWARNNPAFHLLYLEAQISENEKQTYELMTFERS